MVVTLPVLFTEPEPGQSPPVAPVVGEVMCTVNVLAACVVPAGTVTGPQVSTPAAIAQLPPQPAPCEAIVQDRPAFVGSVSVKVTPCASPVPVLYTVIVNPIGLPTFTFAASAVFTIWISAGLMVDVSALVTTRPVGGLVVDVAGVRGDPVVLAGRVRGEVSGRGSRRYRPHSPCR